MHARNSGVYIIPLFIVFIMIVMAAQVAEAVRPINISPNNIPNGQVSTPYSTTLQAQSGIPPYFWSITAGSLPPGLFLIPAASPSLTADISGTPTLSGDYTFNITLRDSDNPQNSVTDTYKVTIKPPCSFSSSNIGSISFNNIDPSSPGPILGTISQQILIVCKNNFNYTVTANPASGWTINSGANSVPYTLAYNTGGVGTGAAVPLLNTSQIAQPNYANAVGGYYANNQAVTFTISWTQAGGGSIIASLPAGSANGTILNTCLVSQSPGTLTFTIDPSVAGSTSATIAPDMQIKCTNMAGVVITASSKCGGAVPKLDRAYPACGGNTIPYTFIFPASATGTGFGGVGISLGLGGSVNSANYANAAVGTYGDLLTLTINY